MTYWLSCNSKPFSAKYLLRKVLAKERTTGPIIKAINPWTWKPGTKTDANQKQIPLIIRENPPNVRYVKGKDKILMVGLTPLLIKPITTAAIKAAGKLIF